MTAEPTQGPTSSPLYYDLQDLVLEVELLRRTNAELERMSITEEEGPFVRAVIRENVCAIAVKCSKAYDICKSLGVPVPAGLQAIVGEGSLATTKSEASSHSVFDRNEKQAIGLLL